MSLLNKKELKQRVQKLLADHPILRDDDLKLLANVWKAETNLSSTAESFLRDFAAGRLSHPESVRRQRQLLQSKNASLRGERYGQRIKQEAVEREFIRSWKH